MSFADAYFSKQKDFHSHIADEPSRALQYSVVIPACSEMNIIPVINSLYNAIRPEGLIEVLVVVNAPDNANEEVLRVYASTLKDIESWNTGHNEKKFRVYGIPVVFPARIAGVGLARKTGMDEATWRFNSIQKPSGLILSYDADCTCDPNYFTEIERHIQKFPSADGFNLYFEHPLSGNDFPQPVYDAIIHYELHLRYYVEALRYAGFPFAFHTVGSCYAVKADAYASQGGMNRKKSGEDFYFLHKIIPLGNFHEINTTRVIPSPRPSDRVPFGTGPAVRKYIQQPGAGLLTYHPQLFVILKDFFPLAALLYKKKPDDLEKMLNELHPLLKQYLNSLKINAKIEEINGNCSSQRSYLKRFFTWFDAFAVLKFLNFASSGEFSKVPVEDAALAILRKKGIDVPERKDAYSLLELFREVERNGNYISPLQQ